MNPADVEEKITEASFATVFDTLNKQPPSAEVAADKGIVQGNYALFNSFKGNASLPPDLRYQQALALREPNLRIHAKYAGRATPGPASPGPSAPSGPSKPQEPAPKAESSSSDGPGIGLALIAAAGVYFLLRGK